MSGAAVLGELEEAIAWLQEFPALLQRTTDGIARQVNTTLSAVPPFLSSFVDDIVAQVEALLVRLGELSQQLLDWLAENVWPVIHGPLDLLQAGDDWVTQVYSRVTGVAGQIDLSETGLEDYWQGPAATTYLHTVIRQKGTANAVADAVSATRSALHELALTLIALYLAVVAALLLAVIELSGGAAACASYVGIPVGLVVAVQAVAKAIGSVAAVYAVGKELVNGAKAQFSTLLELRNDSRAFDHGSWPAARADLADASMTDGDRSNWSYKR